MGRSQRDCAAHPVVCLVGPQPSPNRQTPHAVPDQQRGYAGGLLQLRHRRIDDAGVVLDVPEHRFQVDSDEGNAKVTQATHPGVPQAPVADKTVYQHQPRSALGPGGQMIGLQPGPEGLSPGKHRRRGPDLRPPGLAPRCPGNGWPGFGPALPGAQGKGQGQPQRVAAQEEQHHRRRRRQPRPALRQRPAGAPQQQRQPGQHQHGLQARQHQVALLASCPPQPAQRPLSRMPAFSMFDMTTPLHRLCTGPGVRPERAVWHRACRRG